MTIAIHELQRIKDSAKGFAELMALYEKNYIRFNQLVRNIDHIEGENHSIKSGNTTLYLELLERCRYTTTVLLTYRMELPEGKLETPGMKVRIYHDARQAEVMSCCRDESSQFNWLNRSACGSTLQWRWRMNWFLYKWLNHCLKTGHTFPQQINGISWDNLLKSL